MRTLLTLELIILSSPGWLAGCAQESGSDEAAAAAYLVVNFRVTDPEAYATYPPLARATVAAHGGEFLVVDRQSEVIEGESEPVTVVIRFPSKEAARAWYNSPEYQDIVDLRLDNSEGFAVLTAGVAPPQ